MRESVVVMSNHQSFIGTSQFLKIDWLVMFPFALRQGRLGCCNFFAKDSVKYIPGMVKRIFF
jgi:1-acyl-sn-glycerol-3-phosphate acyltransferase